MIKKENLKKIFQIKKLKKRHQFRHCITLILLILVACGNSGSKQKGDALQETKDKKTDSELEAYVIPSGVKLLESRAIDPNNPPIVIDIANRKLKIGKFDISDYYTSVRYVKLKHPKSATEGNFLFDAIIRVSYDGLNTTQAGMNTLFRFTDDHIIAGDPYFGIHCYDKEGNFLYTLEANDSPMKYNVAENTISLNTHEKKGFTGELFLNRNICMYKVRDDNNKNMLRTYDLSLKEQISIKPFDLSLTFLNANSMNTVASYYFYHPLDTSRNFLYTFDIKGDTLCRFPSYLPVVEKEGRNFYSIPPSNMYYYNDQLTIQQSMNDTVYRVVSPNRLVPAFVLNFGLYKADARTILTEDQHDKMRPDLWFETDRYILFTYTHGRNAPINRQNGLVKFFYSYYDKKSRQLYHLNEGTTVQKNEFLIENPLPDALPFMLSKVDIENNQFRVCYNKKRLEEIINSKGFSSLPSVQQNRLKTFHKELDDNEVLIMILE